MKILNDPQRLEAFADRLNLALDAAGVSRKGLGRQTEVARAMDMSVRGARRWLEGEAYPSPEKLIELAERYHTSVDWLLAGRGNPPPGVGVQETPGVRAGYIPHLAWPGVAPWVETGKVETDVVLGYLPYADAVGPRGFAVSVVDDTMQPDFPEGGILCVDPDLTPVSGSHVLARTDTGEITFKRLILDGGRTFLRPLNTHYPVQQVADVRTYGVVKRLVVVRDFGR